MTRNIERQEQRDLNMQIELGEMSEQIHEALDHDTWELKKWHKRHKSGAHAGETECRGNARGAPK